MTGAVRAVVLGAVLALGLPASDSGADRELDTGIREATGRFEPMIPTDPREAAFAARVLARAALIDGASEAGDAVRTGRTVSDVAAAMARLTRAIPDGEVITTPARSPPGTVDQTIRAAVVPIGGADAPRIRARIGRADIRPGDPLTLTVTSAGGPAHVAVFAWQADDSVALVLPVSGPSVRVEADREAALPPAGAPSLSARPMPGSEVTVEALLVLAASHAFDPADLARAINAVVSDGLPPTEMSAFLSRLARRDPARLALAVLPYRVHGGAAPIRYTITLKGFDPAQAAAIVEVMTAAFPGYLTHGVLPDRGSMRHLRYESTAGPVEMRRWLTLLLEDMALRPGRDWVFSGRDLDIAVERR